MSSDLIHGACPHDCPDTCGIISEVENGRAVNFYADPNHPVTQGWLCAKVRPYLERVYHPDRLTHPLESPGRQSTAAQHLRRGRGVCRRIYPGRPPQPRV